VRANAGGSHSRKATAAPAICGCGTSSSSESRIETTCLVCGVKIHVYPGQRYCKEHERLRSVQCPLTVTVDTRWKPVQFNDPEPCETLLWAARSIKVYRPDGTLDAERTSIERGRWLTRKLQGPWTEAT
jgi:hypothetical protein